MLEHLVRYAQTHNLETRAGFSPKTVRWGLVFDGTGRFLQVMELGDTSLTRNPGQEFVCPDLTPSEIKSIGGGCRHFLVDSVNVVALLAESSLDPKHVAKLQANHRFFLGLLRDARSVIPGLEAIAGALVEPASLARIRQQLADAKARPTDKATITLLGREPPWIVESGEWHRWWEEKRVSLLVGTVRRKTSKRRNGTNAVPCLASGDCEPAIQTHPPIDGLGDVGGLTMGASLVSFDKEAFCSFGLKQGENAAISESAALMYSAALNDLIKNHGRRLVNAKVVHWFRNRVPVEDDVFDWLVNVTGPDQHESIAQHRATQLLDAIRTGTRPDLASNRYFAATVSGAAGRVMVRDWMEGSFEELAGSIDRWFRDLEIAHRDGQERMAPPPKFLALLGATTRDLKDASPATEVGLWRAAARRTPIPFGVLAQTLDRLRLDIVTGETLRHERFALLKAYHVRKGDSHMQAALNGQHPAPAYHCGRLMAVLAALQRRALPGVEAGVVQRYYAAASVTPALVLGRLVRTAQFHLNKLDGGLAHWYENRLADVWSRIGDTVPRTLSIEEQSLFALGYYHQLAYDRRGPSPTTPERGENAEESSHV